MAGRINQEGWIESWEEISHYIRDMEQQAIVESDPLDQVKVCGAYPYKAILEMKSWWEMV